MSEKLSEHVIRFEDIPPYLGLPKAQAAGYFRPEYIYVGPPEKSMKKCDSYEFHLVMIPPGNSTSSIHIRPEADVFILVMKGRCLFWDETGDKVLLNELDALYLRNHPYAYRNVGTDTLWLAVVIAPPNAPPTVYGNDLLPKV